MDEIQFIPEYYKQVSVDELISNPSNYTGRDVCISGFLAKNNGWLGEVVIPAIFHNLENATSLPEKSIMISIIYSDPIRWFGLPRKAQIHGFYSYSLELNCHMLVRIDRIDGEDGKYLYFGSEIDTFRFYPAPIGKDKDGNLVY